VLWCADPAARDREIGRRLLERRPLVVPNCAPHTNSTPISFVPARSARAQTCGIAAVKRS